MSNSENTQPTADASRHTPKSYADIGMPLFPLPLSRDSSTILTCAGLPFAIIQSFDDLQLLPRWDGYSMGNNNLTRAAELVVEAVNAHARLTRQADAAKTLAKFLRKLAVLGQTGLPYCPDVRLVRSARAALAAHEEASK